MFKKRTPRDYIPSLNKLYNKTARFIEAHQSNKGYIDTQDCGMDTIYGIVFDQELRFAVEQYVYGVRVREGDIQVVLEPIMASHVVKYGENDFRNEDNWQSIKNGDIYYVHTLLSIAECIDEYIDN